jgi:hypothetical protein
LSFYGQKNASAGISWLERFEARKTAEPPPAQHIIFPLPQRSARKLLGFNSSGLNVSEPEKQQRD